MKSKDETPVVTAPSKPEAKPDEVNAATKKRIAEALTSFIGLLEAGRFSVYARTVLRPKKDFNEWDRLEQEIAQKKPQYLEEFRFALKHQHLWVAEQQGSLPTLVVALNPDGSRRVLYLIATNEDTFKIIGYGRE